MSAFKKGDRVLIQFEATISSFDAGDRRVHLSLNGEHAGYIPVGALTKVYDPIPTVYGSVILVGGYAFQLENGGWYTVGENSDIDPKEMQSRADASGFTVLLDKGAK